MIEGEPSRTALLVAAARAAHLRYDPPPHLLDDPLAEQLLADDAEQLISMYSNDAHWILLENRIFLPLRARYAEERIAQGRSRGVRQVVVLGAGLDSYAFRQPSDQDELRVFEVDHPSTQRWKAARVQKLGWKVPANLTLVSCNFEKEAVSEVLRSAGFAPDEPSIVTWLGVIYYLAPETAHRSLLELRGILSLESELVLDYLFPYEDLPMRYQELQREIGGYLKGAGEPQVNRYRARALRRALLDAGFSEVLLESPEEIQRRYASGGDNRIPSSERFGFAVAKC